VIGQSRDDVLTVVQAGGHHPGSHCQALNRISLRLLGSIDNFCARNAPLPAAVVHDLPIGGIFK
jgi:hypothetical protein